MRIGELAARAGTTTRTLRYCECDLKLLEQIRTLQDFGFDLEETRPFVECLRAGHPEGDTCPASLAVHRRKLDELDALIGQPAAVRETVARQLARAELASRRR
ncbi:MerR family DNA-binding protein [Streptomyces coeruleorubidus]